MPFFRLFYHIVWSTSGRQPMITPEIESTAHEAIRRKVAALDGRTYAIDGTEDHVHLGASIPPTISISKFVGEVKGASSYHINHQSDSPAHIEWARGFGVVSFRRDNLDIVVGYIRGQKEHHRSGKLWATLEDCGEEEDLPSHVREDVSVYDPWGHGPESDMDGGM